MGFEALSVVWALRPLGSSIESSFFPADLPSGRPPLLLHAWGVCHKSGLSLTLLLNQGENGQGRKQLKPGDVLRDGHPNPKQSLCPPSLTSITPGLVHPMPSHYYNVHPRLSTHHPALHPYQSSIPSH